MPMRIYQRSQAAVETGSFMHLAIYFAVDFVLSIAVEECAFRAYGQDHCDDTRPGKFEEPE